MPEGIILLATPEGRRHSVLAVEGRMLCGRLADVPVNAGPAEARPPRRPRSWNLHTTATKYAST
jgi:hypothetical protein